MYVCHVCRTRMYVCEASCMYTCMYVCTCMYLEGMYVCAHTYVHVWMYVMHVRYSTTYHVPRTTVHEPKKMVVDYYVCTVVQVVISIQVNCK